jgi:hypothetical protein
VAGAADSTQQDLDAERVGAGPALADILDRAGHDVRLNAAA